MQWLGCAWAAAMAIGLDAASASAQSVPLSGIGRFQGWRDNALIGYGIVTGLAGSGDTRRSAVTRQALRNVFSRLGTNVTEDQISSRNVAVVMVTAQLPASANVGDTIDATISSVGDARSLAGGTLIMTPLLGPDRRAYALAQGALTAGGYNFERDLNVQQRNHPTTAIVQGGATVELSVDSAVLQPDGELAFLLADPSFSSAQRVALAINQRFGRDAAWAKNADEVRIRYAGGAADLTAFLATIETVMVDVAAVPRIVINERTGTIVAGGDVTVSSVVIAQGDLKVTVTGQRTASQPGFYSGFASDVQSLVVTNTTLEVEQGDADIAMAFPTSTIGDLVQGLARARVDTRRTISILQAMKAAGALHADIIIQ